MKYFLIALAFAVSAWAVSVHPAAAQCTTTVSGNSSDDGTIIAGCTNINSSSVSVRNRGFTFIRNRVSQNSGGNTVFALEDMTNVSVTPGGSSLTQTLSYLIGVVTINF